MPGSAEEISAVILAGGRGRRMGGADKGLVKYRQRPLVEWVLDAIRPQVSEVLISANRNVDVYAQYGCRVVSDTLPEFPGPLAGVLSTMEVVNTPWLLVTPCDSPHLPANLAQNLLDAAQAAGVPIAVAADAQHEHYITMLVQTRLADSLRDYLHSGQRAVHAWQQGFNPARLTFAREELQNFNTLAEMGLPSQHRNSKLT